MVANGNWTQTMSWSVFLYKKRLPPLPIGKFCIVLWKKRSGQKPFADGDLIVSAVGTEKAVGIEKCKNLVVQTGEKVCKALIWLILQEWRILQKKS
jgi:hypothetical protein